MSNKREALEAALRAAMKKAFNLGQTYWQQADSHFVSQQNKSDITREEFNKLVNDTVRSTLAEPEPEQEAHIRYCPQCSHIGEVAAPASNCCPDGHDARIVPARFAWLCREMFRRAIATDATPVLQP